MGFISDIAELAKAGYKPQDVKELMELNKSQGSLESQTQSESVITDQTALQTDELTSDKSEETAPKESAQHSDEPNYKELYEAEKEKVSALQNKYNSMDVSQNNITVNEDDLLNAISSFC